MFLDYVISASDSGADTSVSHVTEGTTVHAPGLADVPYAAPIFVGMAIAIIILLVTVFALAQSRRSLKNELKELRSKAK